MDLQDRNQQIYSMRKDGRTLQAIGNEFGLTRQSISVICHREQLLEVYRRNVDNQEPIEVLDLGTRAYNALSKGGFRTIGDIARVALIGQLSKTRFIGPKMSAEIKQALHKLIVDNDCIDEPKFHLDPMYVLTHRTDLPKEKLRVGSHPLSKQEIEEAIFIEMSVQTWDSGEWSPIIQAIRHILNVNPKKAIFLFPQGTTVYTVKVGE